MKRIGEKQLFFHSTKHLFVDDEFGEFMICF